MKRVFSFLLLIIMLLCGCGVTSGNDKEPKDTGKEQNNIPNIEVPANYKSLILDSKYKNGFHMNGLHAMIYGDAIERFTESGLSLLESKVNFQYGETGYNLNGVNRNKDSEFRWVIHQAASRYPFNDITNSAKGVSINKFDQNIYNTPTFNYSYSKLGDSKYLYENQSKTIEVDTKSGEIALLLKGSECYKGPRENGQEWPHLILLQDWNYSADDLAFTREEYAVKNIDSIKMQLACKVDYFKDCMGDEADGSMHSAICMYYMLIGYKAPEEDNISDFLYLGLPVFDNRLELYPGNSSQDGGKASATRKWIMNLPANHFYTHETNSLYRDNKIAIDKWATVNIEMYPYIETAFRDAKAGGCMEKATFDDLYIIGMYLGFELPGTYDLGMTFKDVNIISHLK